MKNQKKSKKSFSFWKKGREETELKRLRDKHLLFEEGDCPFWMEGRKKIKTI